MKSLFALLLFPAVVSAASEYDFTSGENTFSLLETTVRRVPTNGDVVVGALWDTNIENQFFRWDVRVTGCHAAYGQIVINGETLNKTFSWSFEGNRVYDTIAASTCFSYILTTAAKNQPGRKSNDRSKNY